MALSQIQCLDDNNVNPRTHESKPEFFYCEDQRLALEVLLRDGREAFGKFLEARDLRGFLSDPELEVLARTVEPYDPGLELYSEGEDDPTPLSMHYWPDMSDTSIPHMDMGWPDSDGYRGVTRTTVYTQPPMEGQTHIKEVVRKMIAQAQKVIAVVMDIFTDVDIFRDLLDASFKRKISVYILLERTTLPHFLSMCQRANMHTGHLKNLRVRCTGGADFLTRSCTRIRGRIGHRFMFIDGDKAMSGSYSFTWMSSRLDRNLITVTTGQAVDGFDRLFRFLYANSSSVDLRQVGMEPEPEPDPLPQPTMVAAPSAALARKLINPKYALVLASNPSPTTSVDSPKETQDPDNSKKKRRKKVVEEDAPPLHPGLVGLEKACLITYLPVWPEPDPPSDVIGFINIRDTTRPAPVHLQRHEMFETSQAIRFSSPITKAKETLPEVAKPRQLTANHVEPKKPQPVQSPTKAEELVVDKPKPIQVSVAPSDSKGKEEAPEQKPAASGQKFKPEKDTTEALNTVNKLHSNTATSRDVGHDTACLSTQSSNKAPVPNKEKTYHTTQTVHTNSLKSDWLSVENTPKEAETVSSLNKKAVVMYRTHVLKSENVHTSKLLDITDSKPNTEQDTQEKTALSHADSHTQAVNMQAEISSEMTPNTQIPIVHSRVSTSSVPDTQSVSSTSPSQNNHTEFTTEHSSTDTIAPVPSTSSFSSLRPLPSTLTTSKSPLPSSSSPLSSSLTSAPPIPKPRTVQLVIKDSNGSNSQKLPEISVIRKTDTKAAPPVFHNEPTVLPTSPVKKPETVPELQDHSASKTGAQKETYNVGNHKETPQQKQRVTSQETADKEADGRHNGGAGRRPISGIKLQTQSDVLITDAPKAARVNIQEIIPKSVDSKTLMSRDCMITPKTETDSIATIQKDTKPSEKTLISAVFSTLPNEKDDDVANRKANLAKAHEPERLSHYKLTPGDTDESEDVDSVKPPVHTPVSTSPSPHISSVGSIDGIHASAADKQDQQGKQARFTPAVGLLNSAKHNTDGTFQEQTPKARGSAPTPEKTLHLYLAETYVADLRSPTPERETRLLMGLVRTPTPDGFPSHASSPNSRTATPDFRTPTPNSALSTTSDEYYECSDSPFHEPVFDHMGFLKHGAAEDRVSYTPTITPNASITGTSPACINYSPSAATLGNADTSSCSETSTFRGPARVASSSLLVQKVREPEVTVNVEQKDETRREEPESQGTERRDGEGANRAVDHFKRDEDSTETAEKVKEAPKRQLMLSQSGADEPVDGGVTAGESTNETSTFRGPARVASSSLLAKKMGEPEVTANVEQEDETRRRNMIKRREEPKSKETERRDGEGANRAVDHFKQDEDSTETAEKAPQRRLMLSQSGADEPVNGGVTARESTTETLTFSGPARVSSSSLLAKKVSEQEVTANVEQEDETRRRNMIARREEPESQETDRRDDEGANRAVDHFKQDEDSTETAEKVKEAPKRRLMLSQSEAGKPVYGGVTAGESTNEATQPKVLRSTSDLKMETGSSRGPDKVTSSRERASTQAALRPSGIERRESLQLTRETETLKLLHSPSKHQRVQQPDSRVSSPSRPPRPPRSLSASQSLGPRPWASRQLSQTDSKVPHGGFQDNASSRRRSPSRLAPPGSGGSVGSGRKQVSSSQQSLPSRQPPAAQSRSRPGPAQNQTQYPKPQPSFLHTHSHLQAQPHPQQNQVVSAEEAHGQDDGKVPFSFTFSRLYSLKGLKDKMSKLPTQSKRGGTSSPVQGNKSSS